MTSRDRLAALRRAKRISALDEGFAATLDRIVGGTSFESVLGAAVASRAVAEGHVCADLRELAGRPLPRLDGGAADREPAETIEPCPPLEQWRRALAAGPLANDGTGEPRPLVLDASGRLYLRRYWEYERGLAAAILARAREIEAVLPDEPLRRAIDRLFPRGTTRSEGIDGQRIAAMVAARRRFAVITGGPGTGKTTTVVRILAILVEGLTNLLGRAPRIAVLAPTGKAAGRLSESIARQRASLALAETVRGGVPESASTIHRALGAFADEPGRFRHDEENPLPADVVVVDEASMVPLGLMARLVLAMRPRTRLILLGDRDQLASVEAGSILGDVCNSGRSIGISRALAGDAERIAGETLRASVERASGSDGIGDTIVELEGSRRFDPRQGIGALAAAIKAGDAARAAAVLAEETGVRLVPHPRGGGLAPAIERLIRSRWQGYGTAATAADRLLAFDAFRVLCALRIGPEGVDAANPAIERILARAGFVSPTPGHYAGRAVLVTRNDYEARLFNGDVGVLVAAEDGGEAHLSAAFLAPDGGIRHIAPALLPPHETAFAMTVHKSQGSEFDEVAVILPRAGAEMLTRELLYTAITRARTAAVIQGNPEDVAAAIARRTRRGSGLRDALWGTE
jgi:exodeoxyribonuclease V alpha subunit